MFPSPVLRAAAVRGAMARRLSFPTTATATVAFGSQRRPGLRLRAGATASAATGSCTYPLVMQRRTQYMPVTGKRDQEAFLTQFDPMDVLGVEEGCTIEEIDAAFERMKGKYAANGPSPDTKMLDRVFRAHEILKDPDSPYYVRAHSSQTDRQRLQFQLLPKSKRRMIEAQVGVLLCVLFLAAFMVVKSTLAPIEKSLRAATR